MISLWSRWKPFPQILLINSQLEAGFYLSRISVLGYDLVATFINDLGESYMNASQLILLWERELMHLTIEIRF